MYVCVQAGGREDREVEPQADPLLSHPGSPEGGEILFKKILNVL